MDDVRWFPGARRLLAEARAELPQKDGLCGAFAALVSLRASGFPVADQDEVALAAGTVLQAGGDTSRPPGEPSRSDFRLPLPATPSAELAGTSAFGVARAVERLSGGDLAAVPACGDWAPETVTALLDGAHLLPGVVVVANVATGLFGAHDTPHRALEDYLHTGLPPLWMSRWHAGHFVLAGGVLHGREGTLVSVVDSYPSLGERGVHLQPVEHVAAALAREGMPPGGVLLVVPAGVAAAARELVTESGLHPKLWDNGTP